MKWGRMVLGLIVAVGVLLSACGKSGTPSGAGTQSSDAYHKITASQAKQKMKESKGAVILDVRRPDEYRGGHIENAMNVPNETIGTERPKELPDLDAVLLVYCRTGVRSRQASQKLVKLGYKNVYDFGGIQDWTYGTVSE